jgi:D-lactate dehydrogenase (cytochrome)
MFSTNAEGINGYRYGKTAAYVEGISVLLPMGGIWSICRGEFISDANGIPLPNGETLPLAYPHGEAIRPYVLVPGSDLIDIFAGSEGAFGVVGRLTLRLLPAVREQWGVLCFCVDWEKAVSLAERLTQQSLEGAAISAIEFFDRNTLNLIEQHKKVASNLLNTPDIPNGAQAALYIELESDCADAIESALMWLLETLPKYGVEEKETLAASEESELKKMKLFRHAAPEAVNATIDHHRKAEPMLSKISADFFIPHERLKQIIGMYLEDINLSGNLGTVFGHIGNGHPHVNLIPNDVAGIQWAEQCMKNWAESILDAGGGFYCENGIGQTGKKLFLRYADPETLQTRQQMKEYFDPCHILNPWNDAADTRRNHEHTRVH